MAQLNADAGTGTGTGCPPAPVAGKMVSGGWPGWKTGTSMLYSTVSIQNVASTFTASAFGAVAFPELVPTR